MKCLSWAWQLSAGWRPSQPETSPSRSRTNVCPTNVQTEHIVPLKIRELSFWHETGQRQCLEHVYYTFKPGTCPSQTTVLVKMYRVPGLSSWRRAPKFGVTSAIKLPKLIHAGCEHSNVFASIGMKDLRIFKDTFTKIPGVKAWFVKVFWIVDSTFIERMGMCAE